MAPPTPLRSGPEEIVKGCHSSRLHGKGADERRGGAGDGATTTTAPHLTHGLLATHLTHGLVAPHLNKGSSLRT